MALLHPHTVIVSAMGHAANRIATGVYLASKELTEHEERITAHGNTCSWRLLKRTYIN